MAGLVTALKEVLTLETFMSALTTLVPVIAGVLVFAFIYRVVRRLINGAQKGKAKI